MPLYLQAPRGPKAPNYKVRGTHCGVIVDRSTGTPSLRDAKRMLAQWQREIEDEIKRGGPAASRAVVKPHDKYDLPFSAAATAYLDAGKERKCLALLLFDRPAVSGRGRQPTPIDPQLRYAFASLRCGELIKQEVLDHWALKFFPNVSGATRNRHYYTPVRAVLRHVGIYDPTRRPKGANGRKVSNSLTPEEAGVLLKAAYELDAEFGLYCAMQLYTGMRMSEGLYVQIRDVSLRDKTIMLHESKNGEGRLVPLSHPTAENPDAYDLVAALANHPRGLDRDPNERLFWFSQATLYHRLERAKEIAGLRFSPREGGFHLLCHTWATWLVKYGGLNADGLVRTHRWKNISSAMRYVDAEVTDDGRRVSRLPKVGSGRG